MVCARPAYMSPTLSLSLFQELRQDQERIAITQHNARVLELRDAERRMQLEARAAEDAQRMRIEADVTKPLARGGRGDATGAGQTAGRDGRVGAETETEAHPDARRTTVPTSQISDREADAERARRVDWEYQRDPETFVQQRTVDMDVWEASRRRVDAKNAQQSQHEQGGSQVEPTLKDAHDRRAARRAEMDKREAERERARRFMMQSPLSAFDVSTGSWEQRPKQQQQQQSTAAPGRQRLGRPSNPSGEWSPEAWQPRPAERGSK